ncbi:MAG: hypothetical protein HUU55_23305 [Myxococcales bacterium]|nr:hypothetical protein [Myxococcales bacterium]
MVSVVDAVSGRVVIAIPAHTPGFVTDGKRTLLKAGECLSALIPVPPGATHRALILRVVGKNTATKETAAVDLSVTATTLGALAITDSLQTDAGALTAKQVDFFEAWAPLAPLIGTEEDQAGLYADLKAQALSGKGGAP